MANTMSAVEQSERSRPQRLCITWDSVEESWERDVRNARENGPEAASLWQWHVRVWQGNSRLYGPEAVRILYGRPDRIEPHAIILFY